jgi:hypothetical protein
MWPGYRTKPSPPFKNASRRGVLALPFGFLSPEIASVGSAKPGALIATVTLGDRVTLAAMRAEFADDADAFDRFVPGVRRLAGESVRVLLTQPDLSVSNMKLMWFCFSIGRFIDPGPALLIQETQ